MYMCIFNIYNISFIRIMNITVQISNLNSRLKSPNADPNSLTDIYGNVASRPGMPEKDDDFFMRISFAGDNNPYCFDWLDIIEVVKDKG